MPWTLHLQDQIPQYMPEAHEADQLLQMEEHSADGETLQGFPYNQMHHYVNKITACYQTYQRLYAGQ